MRATSKMSSQAVEAGLDTRASLAALLSPGRVDAFLIRQISIEDARLRAVRPQLGWKPGQDAPFTPEGLERLMQRRGFAADIAAWKLAQGSDVLDDAQVSADVGLIVEVTEPEDAHDVAEVAADWARGGRHRRPVTVELPESSVVDPLGGRPLAAGLRAAGIAVAVHGCSGDRAAVRQLRRERPGYIRIDGADSPDDDVAAIAFKMTALVAAAEGWRTVAAGVTTANAVSFARACGIDMVEGPRQAAATTTRA